MAQTLKTGLHTYKPRELTCIHCVGTFAFTHCALCRATCCTALDCRDCEILESEKALHVCPVKAELH
eukprot:382008-Amphidinium_carterae.1